MSYETPIPIEPQTVTGDPILDVGQSPVDAMLVYSGQVDSYNPPLKVGEASRAKITLLASNNTGKTIAFRRISLRMLLTKIQDVGGKRLFTEDNPDNWVDPKVNEERWKKRRAAREAAAAKKKAEAEVARKEKEEKKKPEAELAKKPEVEAKKKAKEERVAKQSAAGEASRSPIGLLPVALDESHPRGSVATTDECLDVGQATKTLGHGVARTLGLSSEEPDPEPVPPPTPAAYVFTPEKLKANTAGFRVRWESGEVVFEVIPLDADGNVNDDGKLILPAGAKIRIVLEGEVPTFGTFVLQATELWADPTDKDSSAYDDKFPDEFISVELGAAGGGEVDVVTYETAKKLQGITEEE